MKEQQIGVIINKAKDSCERSGVRLTEKRKRILEILLVAGLPLSAYEIADAYNKTFDESIPAMTVYRILDFLETEHLLHKLSSTNKYVSCSHISNGCKHDIPQFLICGKCQSTKEISISKSVMDELEKIVIKAGYTLTQSQLELRVLCNSCSTSEV